tara:strand:+ start:1251 stop:2879 length:1629 start_codon:yes stop_codon:yes gene_type:complete
MLPTILYNKKYAWRMIILYLVLYNRHNFGFYSQKLTNFILYKDKRKLINAFIFRLMIKTPLYKDKYHREISKVETKINLDIVKLEENIFKIKTIPEDGESIKTIETNLKSMIYNDTVHSNLDKISGAIYNKPDSKEIKLFTMVLNIYCKTNPLHADVFPSLISMEKDIVSMTKKLFNCPEGEGSGTMTSGGTESIILALVGYREYARKHKGIYSPEMVAPITVHCAFDKGCKYLGITLHKINIDRNNNIDKCMLLSHINHNTILLVGSAPSFPNGIIDDISLLGKLGKQYDIPVHVDACLGGFVLPFLDSNTKMLPKFDFLVEGVTSISADTHKYGCCPKGSSVLLFKKKTLLESCYFIQSDWTGGIYATTNLTGSRSGLSIAWTWSTLRFIGKTQFYIQANNISDNVIKIRDAFNNDNDVFIFGQPNVCVVAFGSDVFDIYILSQKMKALGWHLNELQNPPSFHLCVTNRHTKDIIDLFIKDLKQSIHEIINDKKNNSLVSSSNSKKEASVSGSIYGTTQKVPDQNSVDAIVKTYLNAIHV